MTIKLPISGATISPQKARAILPKEMKLPKCGYEISFPSTETDNHGTFNINVHLCHDSKGYWIFRTYRKGEMY